MDRIAIVIVTYNAGEHIGACLDAARGRADEIIVVDNASRDSTCAEAEQRGVTVLNNQVNAGFAAAANRGISAARAKLIVLLNPDARLCTSLDGFRKSLANPQTAACGGLLLDDSGTPQAGFAVRRFPTLAGMVFEALGVNRLWPRNPVNWKYRCLDLDLKAPQFVDQPAGALLCFRRSVWSELGGFDEAFRPLWFEDVDFCRRIKERGYAVAYTPEVVAYHTGAHSILKIPLENRNFYWYGGFLRYAAKHFSGWGVRLLGLAVLAGSVLRIATGVAHRRNLEPMAEFGVVFKLAARYLALGRRGCIPATDGTKGAVV